MENGATRKIQTQFLHKKSHDRGKSSHPLKSLRIFHTFQSNWPIQSPFPPVLYWMSRRNHTEIDSKQRLSTIMGHPVSEFVAGGLWRLFTRRFAVEDEVRDNHMSNEAASLDAGKSRLKSFKSTQKFESGIFVCSMARAPIVLASFLLLKVWIWIWHALPFSSFAGMQKIIVTKMSKKSPAQ